MGFMFIPLLFYVLGGACSTLCCTATHSTHTHRFYGNRQPGGPFSCYGFVTFGGTHGLVRCVAVLLGGGIFVGRARVLPVVA
jgi:hypothetical protein